MSIKNHSNLNPEEKKMKSTIIKRCIRVCRKCIRFETYGTPPENTTNYLCLGADAFRIEGKKEYEEKQAPHDCPFLKKMKKQKEKIK